MFLLLCLGGGCLPIFLFVIFVTGVYVQGRNTMTGTKSQTSHRQVTDKQEEKGIRIDLRPTICLIFSVALPCQNSP